MDLLDEKVIQPLEKRLLSVGIDSSGKAGLAVAAVVAAVLFVVKPVSMFDPTTGKPRQWSGFSDSVNPTPVTWWLASGGIGWGVSLII